MLIAITRQPPVVNSVVNAVLQQRATVSPNVASSRSSRIVGLDVGSA